jgi:hypothetical protein
MHIKFKIKHSIHFYFVINVIFLFITPFACFSQIDNIVPHQWIVSWKTCNYTRSEQIFGINSTPLTQEPLQLSLLTSDPLRLSDESVEKWLKDHPCVDLYQKNHFLDNRIIPNDENFGSQYHHVNNAEGNKDLDSDLAWDITTGGNTALGDTAVICVIDNGINANHLDLYNNLWKNHREIKENNLDDDGNGYVDDFYGWSVETKDDNISNNALHGTSVTGVVGAQGNNNIGVAGMMWNTKIMFVDYDIPTEANAIAAYSYPYAMRKLYNQTQGQKGAYVIATNSSWGRDRVFASEAPLWCAMYDSLGKVGVISVAATTNSNVDVDLDGDLPTTCNSPFLITVTNVAPNDTRTTAGYGRTNIDLGAYGRNILTTSVEGYSIQSGTSLSSPLVTGVLGLMFTTSCNYLASLSKLDPAAAALTAKQILLKSTIPLASLERYCVSSGKLNAHRALLNTLSLCDPCNQITLMHFTPFGDSIGVSWQSVGTLNSINLRYRTLDELQWTTVTNISNGDFINNLKYCTDYEIQWQNTCGLTSEAYSFSNFVKTTACCESLLVVNEEVEGTNVKISWPNSKDATSSDIYLRKVGGSEYELYESDTNFVTIQGLDLCTKYEYYVVLNCDDYDKESPPSKTYSFSTDCGQCSVESYCLFSDKNAEFEWIEGLYFGDIKISKHTDDDKDGYENFIGVASTDVEVGKTYPFMTVFGYKDGISQSDFYRLYIDWDANGSFELTEEMANQTNQILDSVRLEITVPLNAKLGKTRLRHILSYSQFYGPCDDPNFEFGEIEDYCINVIDNTSVAGSFSQPYIFPTVTDGLVHFYHSFTPTNIHNSIGEIVWNNYGQVNVAQLDLSSFIDGVYFVHGRTEKGRPLVIKFLKIGN